VLPEYEYIENKLAATAKQKRQKTSPIDIDIKNPRNARPQQRQNPRATLVGS